MVCTVSLPFMCLVSVVKLCHWHNCGLFQIAITSAGTFWLFASVCTLSIIFTMAFIPETKGKTLEQIEATFRGTSGPWSPPPTGQKKLSRQKLFKVLKQWSWLKHFLIVSFYLWNSSASCRLIEKHHCTKSSFMKFTVFNTVSDRGVDLTLWPFWMIQFVVLLLNSIACYWQWCICLLIPFTLASERIQTPLPSAHFTVLNCAVSVHTRIE